MKNRIPDILFYSLLVILLFSAIGFALALISPKFDQQRLPNFIAAFTSIVTAITALASWGVIREMQKDRETLFRPEVYLNIEKFGQGQLIVLQNFGKSPAHDVQVKLFPSPRYGENTLVTEVTSWLRQPVPTMLPGVRFSQEIDSTSPEFGVEIEYSSGGQKYAVPRYILSPSVLRDGNISFPQVERSLEEMNNNLFMIFRAIDSKHLPDPRLWGDLWDHIKPNRSRF